MGVIDTESYPPLPRELDPLPPSGGPMWRRQAPAQPLEDDLSQCPTEGKVLMSFIPRKSPIHPQLERGKQDLQKE